MYLCCIESHDYIVKIILKIMKMNLAMCKLAEGGRVVIQLGAPVIGNENQKRVVKVQKYLKTSTTV